MSRERVPTVGTRPADGHDGVSHVNKSQDLQERRSELRDCVQQALSAGSLSLLQPLLEQQHPTDLAEVLGLLDDVDRQTVLGHLSEAATAQVVAELDPSAVRGVAEGLDDERFADLVEQMDPDDAADVLGDLSDEQSEKVLEHMEQDGAREVRALLTYDEHTAGGIMTSRLVSCSQTDTVADAVNRLRSWSEQEEEIHYLYVVDDEQRLLGTVPLKRLVVAAADSSLSHITSRDPIVVHTGADQEEYQGQRKVE